MFSTGFLKTSKEILKGGKADGISDKKFDPKKVLRGMKHEAEHTNNKKIQKEIAKDHLTEDPNYYQHLAKVEKMASDISKVRSFMAAFKAKLSAIKTQKSIDEFKKMRDAAKVVPKIKEVKK